MEMQLSSLIDKIKQEGVKEASNKADEIITQAQTKEKTIIRQAQDKAKLIIQEAQAQAAKLKDNSEKAIAQAARDVVLSLKEEIKNLFTTVLKEEIQHNLSDDFICELISKIAMTWGNDAETGLDISLSPKDKDRLENLILSGAQKKLAKGIDFKASTFINKGLYVGKKGEDFYYDFSDEAMLGILKEHLRPFIAKLLQQSKA